MVICAGEGTLTLELEGKDYEYYQVADLNSILVSGLLPQQNQINITLPGIVRTLVQLTILYTTQGG